MALSFTADGPLGQVNPQRRKVLVTGASGSIGSYFSEHSHDRYDLSLMVHVPEQRQALERFGDVLVGDLADLEGLTDLCKGIDTVVHLAATPSPTATWSVVLQANIIGTYNLMVAAKAAGCRRVIYASSIHAVSGYPKDMQVKTTDPVNPGDIYGVSKCFGEALGRYMAEQEGLSVIALRIGAFQPHASARKEGSLGMMDAWVSQRDLTSMIHHCIDVENVKFAVFNALSNNRFKRLDMTDAKELLGWEPQDDFTSENPDLKGLELGKQVKGHSKRDGKESGIREELGQARSGRGGRGRDGKRSSPRFPRAGRSHST